MNLAVIGSGGREHSICYKLKRSSKIKNIICIPGNAGTQKIAKNIKADISNFESVYQIIKKNNRIFSNGGRVLNVTTLSKNLTDAREKSLITLKKINWNDGFFRKDIGWKVIENKKI